MITELLTEQDIYRSSDLALAGVIFLSYPLDAIDRQPNSQKAYFVFKRDDGLDELVEGYWRGELQVEPQAYFQSLRTIKARLYGES